MTEQPWLDQGAYYSGVLGLISETIKEIVFPKYCVSCHRLGSLLCPECWLKVQFLYEQVCPVCRHPSVAGRTHAGCATTWGIDGVISLTYYSGPIRGLIRQLKYRGATITQELISQLMVEYDKHESMYLAPAIITPIPLHASNLRRRGFNQAEIIASALSAQLSYPQVPDVIYRQRPTVSQTTLAKQQRQQNIRGAFKVSSAQQIKGADFILVDDVFTTGATLREAAKTLKRAGAHSVFGFTLARD